MFAVVSKFLIPVKCKLDCGSPREGMIVLALHQVDSVSSYYNLHTVCFRVHGDGAEICVDFVVLHLFGPNQLTVDCDSWTGGKNT